MSALSNEVQAETTTIEHLGREWTLPTRRHLRHIRELSRRVNEDVIVSQALMVAEVFLSGEDFDALVDLDPSEPDLNALGHKIADALGLENSGNSSPSSASS